MNAPRTPRSIKFDTYPHEFTDAAQAGVFRPTTPLPGDLRLVKFGTAPVVWWAVHEHQVIGEGEAPEDAWRAGASEARRVATYWTSLLARLAPLVALAFLGCVEPAPDQRTLAVQTPELLPDVLEARDRWFEATGIRFAVSDADADGIRVELVEEVDCRSSQERRDGAEGNGCVGGTRVILDDPLYVDQVTVSDRATLTHELGHVLLAQWGGDDPNAAHTIDEASVLAERGAWANPITQALLDVVCTANDCAWERPEADVSVGANF